MSKCISDIRYVDSCWVTPLKSNSSMRRTRSLTAAGSNAMQTSILRQHMLLTCSLPAYSALTWKHCILSLHYVRHISNLFLQLTVHVLQTSRILCQIHKSSAVHALYVANFHFCSVIVLEQCSSAFAQCQLAGSFPSVTLAPNETLP